MPRIKIDSVIEHLSNDMRHALADTVNESHVQGHVTDGSALFRSFVRAVRKKCGAWVNIPDEYVERRPQQNPPPSHG